MYHAVAGQLGILAGFCTLAGAAILIYRRRTVGPVFSATTRNDKAMYVLLIGTIVLGLGTTVLGNLTGHPHDYRQTVSPWFRSIFYFQPDTDLILRAPIGFRLHVLAAWVLFAFWPFSRLVHVFSRTDRLPHPSLHRLPQPRRPARRAHPEAWLGASRMTEPIDLPATRRRAARSTTEGHDGGRAAKTVLHEPGLRATLIALRAGHELAEHDAPPAASLFVVSGDVRLRSIDRRPGADRRASWSPIPHERHALLADSDAIVLLTVRFD